MLKVPFSVVFIFRPPIKPKIYSCSHSYASQDVVNKIFKFILQQLAPDNLLPDIKSLLGDEVGNVAKLAIVILFEQKLDKVPWTYLVLSLIRIS